jgi:Flp pilus assembly pilin Flp
VVKNLVVRFWRDTAGVVTAEYGWVAAGLSLATLVAAIAIATRFGHPVPF